ncbi:MAG: hypothetical protein HDR25_07955 [Lachnospiraceae bacterium]|nr:hypothetical protein [Lachnospiraceae bacterium]
MVVVMIVVMIVIGVILFVNTVFRWDRFSQNFPLKHYPIWKVNTTKYIYETYGDKALRKYLLFLSFVFIALGIWCVVLITKDITERVQIADFPQIQKGDTVSFAGGELTLDHVGKPEGFMAKRFNIDKNRYEEVEVKADAYDETMLLVMTTLTNNSTETLSIVHEDLKFYAKPPEEGNNIKGRAAVDGYLYHDDPIELAAGESVPVWFWLSLTKEEEKQPFWFVLQYGSTGCILGARSGPLEIHIGGVVE